VRQRGRVGAADKEMIIFAALPESPESSRRAHSLLVTSEISLDWNSQKNRF
jgi:hypothetical protein